MCKCIHVRRAKFYMWQWDLTKLVGWNLGIVFVSIWNKCTVASVVYSAVRSRRLFGPQRPPIINDHKHAWLGLRQSTHLAQMPFACNCTTRPIRQNIARSSSSTIVCRLWSLRTRPLRAGKSQVEMNNKSIIWLTLTEILKNLKLSGFSQRERMKSRNVICRNSVTNR